MDKYNRLRYLASYVNLVKPRNTYAVLISLVVVACFQYGGRFAVSGSRNLRIIDNANACINILITKRQHWQAVARAKRSKT